MQWIDDGCLEFCNGHVDKMQKYGRSQLFRALKVEIANESASDRCEVDKKERSCQQFSALDLTLSGLCGLVSQAVLTAQLDCPPKVLIMRDFRPRSPALYPPTSLGE